MSKAPQTLPKGMIFRKDGKIMSNEKPVIIIKEKKPNVFKRIKHWWKEELTEDDRDIFKIAGIWCVDGALWGTLITAVVKDKKIKKVAENAAVAGYQMGQIDAYKEMAQNPYSMMDVGMRKLEQQGKAKKF